MIALNDLTICMGT